MKLARTQFLAMGCVAVVAGWPATSLPAPASHSSYSSIARNQCQRSVVVTADQAEYAARRVCGGRGEYVVVVDEEDLRETLSVGKAARARRRRHAIRRAARTRVSAPSTRSAVSGNNAASALSAPRAWEMARISSQWPRTMIVISEASSHQTSISKSPNVAASEVPNATMIARLMRVIMPGL